MTLAMRRGISDLQIAGVDRMEFYDVVEPEAYTHQEQAACRPKTWGGLKMTSVLLFAA